MVKHIIYQPGAPKAVRYWDPTTEDEVIGHHLALALGPFGVGLILFVTLGLVDLAVVPGGNPNNPDWWVSSPSALSIPFLWVTGIGYHLWRVHYVETRTANGTLRRIDAMFKRLPSELQAEAKQTRDMAIEFDRSDNSLGVQQCERVMEHMRDAHDNRIGLQNAKEAKDPEIGRAMQAAMDYRQETIGLFRAEIETGGPVPEPRRPYDEDNDVY